MKTVKKKKRKKRNGKITLSKSSYLSFIGFVCVYTHIRIYLYVWTKRKVKSGTQWDRQTDSQSHRQTRGQSKARRAEAGVRRA